MTDDRFADSAALDDEALSAYLAGELDEAQAAAIERRLEHEAALAAQLDAMADALVGLHGADTAAPPAGFEQRLQQRLTDERKQAPVDLAAYRERRDRSRLWLGVGTAAAVLVAGTLMAGNMLRGVNGAGDSALTAGGGETAEQEGSSTESAAMADEDTGGESRPSAPVILDENVALADADALRRRYDNIPEAQGLLGVPLEDAEDLAARFSQAISERDVVVSPDTAAGLSSGAGGGAAAGSGASEPAAAPAPAEAPEESAANTDAAKSRRADATDACLQTIQDSADAPLVPVRVETLRYEGRAVIAYVFVTASPDSPALDRTEVWVVRPRSCQTVTFQQY